MGISIEDVKEIHGRSEREIPRIYLVQQQVARSIVEPLALITNATPSSFSALSVTPRYAKYLIGSAYTSGRPGYSLELRVHNYFESTPITIERGIVESAYGVNLSRISGSIAREIERVREVMNVGALVDIEVLSTFILQNIDPNTARKFYCFMNGSQERFIDDYEIQTVVDRSLREGIEEVALPVADIVAVPDLATFLISTLRNFVRK